MKDPEPRFMRLAIARATEGVTQGQTPFGACIIRDDEVMACEHNAVWETVDCTAHAEVQAIRAACLKLNTIDLSGCEIYSTCEPCPMCFSACHWAKLDRIISGAHVADALKAGFRELTVSNATLKRQGGSPIALVSGFMREECLQVFRLFSERDNRLLY